MAITNKEIINNQVKRINEKAKTDLRLGRKNGTWYLYTSSNGTEFPPYPFSQVNTHRTSAQMIEYLEGLEDAIDARPQRVYFIRCEVNDHGWSTGHHHFARLEDAIKLMRNHVALQIWRAREDHKKVFLKVFGDSVMGDVSKNPKRSQTIFVRIDYDTFEYRIWSEELHYSEVPKDKSFNY
jgi:hypothetical protein